jgi:hypothetical protein
MMIKMSMLHWRDDNDKEKPKLAETRPSATSSTTHLMDRTRLSAVTCGRLTTSAMARHASQNVLFPFLVCSWWRNNDTQRRYEICCGLLPMCTTVTAVKALCKNCDRVLDVVQILNPNTHIYINYTSYNLLISVIPSLWSFICCIQQTDKGSNDTSKSCSCALKQDCSWQCCSGTQNGATLRSAATALKTEATYSKQLLRTTVRHLMSWVVGSNPGREMGFLPTPKRPGSLWGPPRLVLN